MSTKIDELHDLLVTNISKMNALVKKEEERKPKWHIIIGAIAIVAALGVVIYCLYRYFSPDYLDDFEDDFDEDYEDELFDDEDEAPADKEEEEKK